LKAIQYF